MKTPNEAPEVQKSKINWSSIIVLWIVLLLVAVIWFFTKSYQSETEEYVAGEVVEYSISSPRQAPELTGIQQWLNSNPLTLEELKGKVVVLDFWTYSCINCIRTLPYLVEWDKKYRADGLVIIGVHSPEFAFEQKPKNVQRAIDRYNISYPVALDNSFATWRAYRNRYWPSKYFIDHEGKLRHTHFGEGDYAESETVIRQLLTEAGAELDNEVVDTSGDRPLTSVAQTPELYLGYSRHDNFTNAAELIKDQVQAYSGTETLTPNSWSLKGDWLITEEYAESKSDEAVLTLNATAKNIFLVMGAPTETAVSLLLNGQAVTSETVGDEDVSRDGVLKVKDFRLYRLINLPEIAANQYLELGVPKGVQLHAFTFGSN